MVSFVCLTLKVGRGLSEGGLRVDRGLSKSDLRVDLFMGDLVPKVT